jgi:hypothetical protein
MIVNAIIGLSQPAPCRAQIIAPLGPDHDRSLALYGSFAPSRMPAVMVSYTTFALWLHSQVNER